MAIYFNSIIKFLLPSQLDELHNRRNIFSNSHNICLFPLSICCPKFTLFPFIHMCVSSLHCEVNSLYVRKIEKILHIHILRMLKGFCYFPQHHVQIIRLKKEQQHEQISTRNMKVGHLLVS
jgi:hypothetical protein